MPFRVTRLPLATGSDSLQALCPVSSCKTLASPSSQMLSMLLDELEAQKLISPDALAKGRTVVHGYNVLLAHKGTVCMPGSYCPVC